MALIIADRVKETSTTTGTGTLTLDGADTGFQTFTAAIGNGNTTFYAISYPTSAQWEIGIGTVGSGTLARTTILASSSGGAAVDLAAGTKFVYTSYPAAKAFTTDSVYNGTLTSSQITTALGFTPTSTSKALAFSILFG